MRKVVVHLLHGVHARVAYRIAQTTKNLASEVLIYNGTKSANGDSILQLLMLDATEGTELELRVEGGDEEKTLDELSLLFTLSA